MTRLSQPTEFQTGFPTRRVERYVAAARAALAFERLWPALWPASGLVGVFLAAALFGIMDWIPWPLHALLLSAMITASGVLLFQNLQAYAWPRWQDGARKLERDTGLSHRPLSEAEDTLSAGTGNSWAEELWRAHMNQRLSYTAQRLRLTLPRSRLTGRDPKGFRFVVLLAVVVGAIYAGRDGGDRLLSSLLSAPGAARATMDAWIDPPAYTGEPPRYLRPGETNVAVPQGSVLNLRVHGADHAPALAIAGSHLRLQGTNGEYARAATIWDDSDVRVRASGRSLGYWQIHAIQDHPPSIAFAAPPSKTEHDAVKLSFRAKDDYGVVSASAIVRPHGRSGPALVVDLPLDSTNSRTFEETAYRDLTAHPYAGLDVDVMLEAKDALGQIGTSRAARFTLPARLFTNPLARALIEQRQNLAAGDAVARDRVVATLDALTIAPERFYQGQDGIYMTLRAAYWALKNAHHAEEIQHVEALLWQTAVALEQGGLANAAEELRRLQQMITQALAQNAPQEVIDALLQRYQTALQRYLQALAQNAPKDNQPLPPGAKVLSEKDLGALLKAIQDLAQSGNRAQAAQMLALLQSLLENLHMTVGQGSGNGSGAPQDKALSNAIQGLGELMGKQRGLLDKTFREQQSGGKNAQSLSQAQGQLRNDLGKLQQGLKGRKGGANEALGEADSAMNEAQNALGNKDLSGAGAQEKEAIEALRKGADALARAFMEEQAGQGSEQGENGDEDPLGRATGNAGNFGTGTKLPSESDLQRARSILEELRRRAGERNRPKEELDYIDRLLKQF